MKNIAIIMGGYSSEYQISLKSGNVVYQFLDKSKYNGYRIHIFKEKWVYVTDENLEFPVDRNDFSVTVDGTKITFDAVFNAIHGTPGEDGLMQAYFELLNIPQSSCDYYQAALTFNKRYTVAVASFAGMHVAKSLHLFRESPLTAGEILQQLQLPVFVKPNNGGSSLGMSKVNEPAALEPALVKAFKEDSQVLVEEYISGREFTIGVFKTKGNIVALPITEVITKNEFFYFQAKYEGASEEITPAKVDEVIADKIRAEAKKAYTVFNCRGVVRIDFIYNEASGKAHMLEINTVPGQSAASIVPQQVRAMGWSLKEFYSALIEECFNRN